MVIITGDTKYNKMFLLFQIKKPSFAWRKRRLEWRRCLLNWMMMRMVCKCWNSPDLSEPMRKQHVLNPKSDTFESKLNKEVQKKKKMQTVVMQPCLCCMIFLHQLLKLETQNLSHKGPWEITAFSDK